MEPLRDLMDWEEKKKGKKNRKEEILKKRKERGKIERERRE